MRPPPASPINVRAMTRRIDVDNRIPLRNYYRIADNLLKQANIYREEKNIIDLYIILLRYSSLVSETIPFHRDYQALYPKEKAYYKKKLFAVLDELEALKPEARRQLLERNKVHFTTQIDNFDGSSNGLESTCSQWPIVNTRPSLRCNNQQFVGSALSSSWKQNNTQFVGNAPPPSWKQNNSHNQVLPANSIDMKLQNLSLGLPLPKQETLSRHSLLGPNGLRVQWLGPSTEIKVNYPTNSDLVSSEDLRQPDLVAVKDGDNGVNKSAMDSVLSLDDGRWLASAEELHILSGNDAGSDHFPLGIISQPAPPPVLAQVQSGFLPISPSRVADPRPGPAKPTQDGIPSSDSFQHLHIPVKMMDGFLRLARENTAKNLETCGVLAGSLKNRVFHITMLIIPKQESTSDSCQTLNEEEIFEIQDKHSLFPLGWIHTHPSQTCFMSSVDLHTHYSYQIMLPEAIAIVMAPTDESSPHGIFHLSDPGGVAVIRNCQQRGFHPHEEPEDGSPIYEHSSHVYMNERLKFDIVDLR